MRFDSKVPRQLTAAERRVEAVSLRAAGFNYTEIGRALGISKQAAFKCVKKALDDLAAKQDGETRAYRALQIQTLEASLKRMTIIAKDPASGPASQIAAENTLLKINERLSRLTGTDAPILTESKTSIARDFTPEQIKQMASFINEPGVPDGSATPDQSEEG
jgi:hypothetical protein